MKSLKFVAAAVSALVPLAGHAVPVKFPKCAEQVRYQDVPGGSGGYFNKDCSVLYVLPPKAGSLSVTGYRHGAEIGLKCDRLRKIEQDIHMLEDVSLNETKRLKRISDETARIEEDLANGLIPIGQTRESLEAQLSKKLDDMDKIRERIEKYQKQANGKKVEFAKEPAGRGQFLMTSAMENIVKAYRDANPRLRVVPLPIDQAFLSVNEIKPEESSSAAMPWILSLRAVGIGSLPMLRDPALLLQFKDLNPGAAPDGSKIFGSALAGEIVVGNLGACGVQTHLGRRESFSAGEIKPYVVASATYSYQVQVERKHKLTYDYQKFVRIAHEQTKKGGFFSTRTLNNMIDDRESSTWIEFEPESNDTRFEYSDAYVREVKKEFVDRALAEIVSLQTGSPAAVLALIEPGQNGAGVIGDELQKCPNLYCQIGAAGMKVLNSIFGSSKATAELIRKLKSKQTELVTEKKMVQMPGSHVFQ